MNRFSHRIFFATITAFALAGCGSEPSTLHPPQSSTSTAGQEQSSTAPHAQPRAKPTQADKHLDATAVRTSTTQTSDTKPKEDTSEQADTAFTAVLTEIETLIAANKHIEAYRLGVRKNGYFSPQQNQQITAYLKQLKPIKDAIQAVKTNISFLTSDKAMTREHTRQFLIRKGPATIPILQKELAQADDEMAQQLAMILAELGDGQSTKSIWQRLQQSNTDRARQIYADSLEKLFPHSDTELVNQIFSAATTPDPVNVPMVSALIAFYQKKQTEDPHDKLTSSWKPALIAYIKAANAHGGDWAQWSLRYQNFADLYKPGWTAQYWSNKTFSGQPTLIRQDSTISIPNLAYPANLKNDISARWTGRLTITESGTYTFAIASDDGSRLYLNKTLLVDNWGDHGVTEVTARKKLQVGTYQLRVDHYQGSGGGEIHVHWIKPDGKRTLLGAPAIRSPIQRP